MLAGPGRQGNSTLPPLPQTFGLHGSKRKNSNVFLLMLIALMKKGKMSNGSQGLERMGVS